MTDSAPLWQWVRDEVIDSDRLRESVLGAGSAEDAVVVLDGFAQRMDAIAQHCTGLALMARLMATEFSGEPVSPADVERWEDWGNSLREQVSDTGS